MALSSTGTAVSDGVYTTLFHASAPEGSGSDGPSQNWVTIKVTAGTATIKIGGTAYSGTARTMSSTDDPWEVVPLKGGCISKIEAAGSGGAATVAFWFNG